MSCNCDNLTKVPEWIADCASWCCNQCASHVTLPHERLTINRPKQGGREVIAPRNQGWHPGRMKGGTK